MGYVKLSATCTLVTEDVNACQPQMTRPSVTFSAPAHWSNGTASLVCEGQSKKCERPNGFPPRLCRSSSDATAGTEAALHRRETTSFFLMESIVSSRNDLRIINQFERLNARLMMAVDVIDVLDLRSDIDGSGRVDFGDFLLLASEFGNSSTSGDLVRSDINMDGRVFFDDFLQLAESFGKDTNVPTASLAVRNDAESVDAAISLFGDIAAWENIGFQETTLAVEVPLELTLGVRDDGLVCDLFGVLGDVDSRCDLVFDGDPFEPNLGLQSLTLEEGGSYLATVRDSTAGSESQLQIIVEEL